MMIRIGLFLLLLQGLTALQGARLEIADGVIGPHSSAVMAIQLRPQGSVVAALQFDLDYPDSLVSISSVPGVACRGGLKQLLQNDLFPGRKRILIVGLNNVPIEDGTIVILYVSSRSSDNTSDLEFVLSNPVAVDDKGNEVRLEGGKGVLHTDTSLTGTQLVADGVLNTASLLPGPIAAGELITLLGAHFGSSPPIVTFNGIPALVLFSNEHRIHTLAPPTLDATEATIEVIRGIDRVALVTVPVAAAAPAIFTEDASGAGPAIALLENGTKNSPINVAAAGTTLTVYATGVDPTAEVTARIDSADAVVFGIEAASEACLGIIPIRIQIPEGISGLALPLTITVSGISSQAGVTVSVAKSSSDSSDPK